MKNPVQYLKLWQEKRSELQINDDPASDWLGMQALLDEHLPVGDLPDSGKSSKPPRFKLLSMMFIALSAAAMVHFAVKFSKPKVNAHHPKHSHKMHRGHMSKSDSLEALNNPDSIVNRPDSIPGANQISALQNTEAGKLSTDSKSLIPAGAKTLPDNTLKTTQHADSLTASKENTHNAQTTNKRGNAPANNSSVAHRQTEFNRIARLNAENHSTSSHLSPSTIGTANPGTQGSNNGPTTLINSSFGQYNSALTLETPRQSFTINNTMSNQFPIVNRPAFRKPVLDKPQKEPKVKTTGSTGSSFEWGLLIGANSKGSFTPKSQNSNFYGRLPVDLFAGAFGSFNFNEKWAFSPQARVLSPVVLSGNYKISHSTQRTDTINITTTRYINDSKKVYSVQVPLYVAYKATNAISLKAGPVFSIPVKQFGIAKIDSANRSILGISRYDQKLDLGLSGGISVRYKRLIFEATYLKGLTSHRVGTDSLSFSSQANSLQFTIGIQLGKKKP